MVNLVGQSYFKAVGNLNQEYQKILVEHRFIPDNEENCEEREQQESKPVQTKETRAKPPAYMPHVPFSQRLTKARNDEEFCILERLKNLYIIVPFTEVITEIPSYNNC